MIATIRQSSAKLAKRYADAPLESTVPSSRYRVKYAVSRAVPGLMTQISA